MQLFASSFSSGLTGLSLRGGEGRGVYAGNFVTNGIQVSDTISWRNRVRFFKDTHFRCY